MWRRIFWATCGLLVISGCSRSELDRCIDTQMASWQQKHDAYEPIAESFRKSRNERLQSSHSEPLETDTGGVPHIDPDLLPPPGDPGPKEQAAAEANLRCGKVYGNG
jgi:hypothetical protein